MLAVSIDSDVINAYIEKDHTCQAFIPFLLATPASYICLRDRKQIGRAPAERDHATARPVQPHSVLSI